VLGGIVQLDSSLVVDKTPSENISASGLFLSKMKCIHTLRNFLCSKVMDMDMDNLVNLKTSHTV
jgi:hypothetical protein